MKEKNEIRAVQLVRRIRDQQAALLEGKSTEEIMEFFRKAGEVAKVGQGRRVTRNGEPKAAPDGFATR